MKHFDVAIVGGGPAGCASAITLSRLGRKVILFEQSDYNFLRIGESLPPIIKPLLWELDVWDSFVSLDPLTSNGIKSAWGSNDLESSSFMVSAYGEGWHIDRQRFDKMLSKSAEKKGTVVLTNSRVTKLIPDPHSNTGWLLEFFTQDNIESDNTKTGLPETTNTVHAKAAINAMGRSSLPMRRFGAKQIFYDNLVGIAVRFSIKGKPEGSFTLVEASEKGWWYSAPVPGSYLMVVFLTDVDIMIRDRLGNLKEWSKLLQITLHTKGRCPENSTAFGPRIFRASSQRLQRPFNTENWLAVGDAAMTFDPLSGSGISFALRSGCDGAIVIDRILSGDISAAKTYEKSLDAVFNQYLSLKKGYYSLETRWPKSLFWNRRCS